MTPYDEFGLIHHLASRLPAVGRGVQIGIGDDAAVLMTQAGEELLVTTDTMVAGVHFLPETMGYADIGFKAMAASISDIAAMGGEARYAVISLAVPKNQPIADMEALYDGVADIVKMYNCPVVGGDVVSTEGPLVVTTTVLGAVPGGSALLRSGARPGDVIFVTGWVGSSGAGLAYLQGDVAIHLDDAAVLQEAHQRPKPQIEAGQILRVSGASSCNDISDGLASELNEIASASGARLRIDANRIPVAPAVRNYARRVGQDALAYAWYGGEDYQLVGTSSPFAFATALARCESIGVKLTQIGRVEPGEGVIALHEDGRLEVIEKKGFNHFGHDDV